VTIVSAEGIAALGCPGWEIVAVKPTNYWLEQSSSVLRNTEIVCSQSSDYGGFKLMKVIRVLILCGLGCVLSGGCHGSELTRSQAKRILDNVAAHQTSDQITISAAQLRKILFIKNGAPFFDTVQRGGVTRCMPDSSDARVATGEFALCHNSITAEGITSNQPGALIRLKVPIKWSFTEITGITAAPGGQNDRIVEYTLGVDLSSFPKEIREPLSSSPLKGKALLRLYDDGWRFVQFM
jgi:hypothetical protein